MAVNIDENGVPGFYVNYDLMFPILNKAETDIRYQTFLKGLFIKEAATLWYLRTNYQQEISALSSYNEQYNDLVKLKTNNIENSEYVELIQARFSQILKNVRRHHRSWTAR